MRPFSARQRLRTRVLGLAGIVLLSAAILPAQEGAPGVQRAWMDLSVTPCDDFFAYANGGWIERVRIPDDMPLWGTAFEMEDRNQQIVRRLLDEVSSKTDWPAGSPQQVVGDFFFSGMDTGTRNRAGATPVASTFRRIAGIRSVSDLAVAMGDAHIEGARAGFGFLVDVDDRRNTRMIVQLAQGGLSLFDRNDYLNVDAAARAVRSAFEAHVVRMFRLLGDTDAVAARQAAAVLRLETLLARASMSGLELRDPSATYHLTTRSRLAREAPGFPWEVYFRTLGIPDREQDMLVRQPGFLKAFAEMARSQPLASWRAYLRWQRLRSVAGELDEAFATESFAFSGTILRGVQAQRPLWRRVADSTEADLGPALGQLFVSRAFAPDARQRALAIAESLRATLKERIRALDWMSAQTKTRALEKVDALRFKIGYPDEWPDDAQLAISRQPFVLNVVAAARSRHLRAISALGRPVDRRAWGVAVSGMFAHSFAQQNEVCFPAGILQPPVFDPSADPASNYAGLGMLLSHELTHGFDDQGRQFDKDGNLKDWWTPDDAAAFNARNQRLVAQFASYRPFPDLPVNGAVTLGENIADLGGVQLAFEAFRKALAGTPRVVGPDGFTPEQRFFIAYAQAYFRTRSRPEYLRRQVQVDNHAPPRYRVNGPLSNMPAFREAFACGLGNAMVLPENQRSSIW